MNIKTFVWNILVKLVKTKNKFFYNIKLSGKLKEKRAKGNVVWLMNTPEHGNLGDQAITVAEYEAFRLMGIDNVMEITTEQYLEYASVIKKHVDSRDVIFLHGGGNLGTLWRLAHDIANDVIKNYPDNKIVIFPQTVYYSANEYGAAKLEEDKKYFASHRDLTLFVRDKASYDLCRENFDVKCGFVPDIVLLLHHKAKQDSRNGVLTCYRTDFEKVLSDERIKQLEQYIKEKNIPLGSTSTVIEGKIYAADRNSRLQTIWDRFASARLVITDRLHGMIFCAVTNTPCIAMNNISKKVSGVYQWIKDCEFIAFVENDFDMELIDKMLGIGSYEEYMPDEDDFRPLLTVLDTTQQTI